MTSSTAVALAPRASVDPVELRRVADRFIAACSSGNMRDLLAVLDPAVVGWADLGGMRTQLPQRAEGAAAVARGVMAVFGPRAATRLLVAEVNGETGVLVALRGRPYAVLVLQVRGDRVAAICAVADPAKLRRVSVPLD